MWNTDFESRVSFHINLEFWEFSSRELLEELEGMENLPCTPLYLYLYAFFLHFLWNFLVNSGHVLDNGVYE